MTRRVLVAFLAAAMLGALALASASASAGTSPSVQLEKGAVRGTTLRSRGGRAYSAFMGLPYARPPVGKHRFKDPKPVKPWQGVWDATSFPAKCLQFERYPVSAILGDEDCLYLNVFTPKLPAPGAPLLDVVVWIHGGGFMYGGSSDWEADYVMDHDVVLVTINYRVGVLGFLSTEDEVVPGNMGLKDQAMALRWVQGNVAAFGGNPNSVTLLGLSAGGASVHYQYLSPLSRGLFHRGWSMSGSALCPWTQQERARDKARGLAGLVGCAADPADPADAHNASAASRGLVECLRRRPARALVAAVSRLQDEFQLPFSPFAPVVEPAGTPAPFLPRAPIDTVRAGLAHDLPWITGITTEEGLYNAAEFLGQGQAHRLEQLEERWLEKAPLLLDFNLTVGAAQRDAVSLAVKEAYFGKKPISAATSAELVAMVGDRIFNAGVEQAAREMARANTQSVFLYEFGFRGENSLSAALTADHDPTDWGVSHGDDCGYVLRWRDMPTGGTEAERTMSRQLLSILTTFARTGVPSGLPGSPGWAPLHPQASDLHLLRIGRKGDLSLSFGVAPELGRTSFWMSQPFDENVPSAAGAGAEAGPPKDEL